MAIIQSILYPSKKASTQKLQEELSGKTILITGASFGIGRLLAEKLSFPGISMILVGRTEENLQEVCRYVEEKGGSATYYAGDLRDESTIKGLFQTIANQKKEVDIFINNAGKSIRRSVYHSLDRFHDYTRTMNLNYYAPVQIALQLIPGLTNKKGQIINISSIIVLLPALPLWSAYHSSKGAFHLWLKSVKPELKKKGIATNNVYLPLVRTRMIAPTKKFEKLPVMEPEQAMEIIARTILRRSFQYKPWWTGIVKSGLWLFKPLIHKKAIKAS
jgi:short-subunit dehydrogenase